MDHSPHPPEPSPPEPSQHGPHDTDSPEATGDYVDGVPTFDFVRDRIEGRYATAMGTTELAEETTAGRSLAQQQEDRDAAARERLEQIRRSLRDD
jgi:phage shock protein A